VAVAAAATFCHRTIDRADHPKIHPAGKSDIARPDWTTAAVTANHAYAVYDTLYAVNAKLEPRPQMADTMGQTLATFVESWGVQDDRTIKITLKSPFPLLIDALAKPEENEPFMMPERIARTDPMQQIKETTGPGPFRFLPNASIRDAAAYGK
jgi:peptide/nickel transport system substrate-binding protein